MVKNTDEVIDTNAQTSPAPAREAIRAAMEEHKNKNADDKSNNIDNKETSVESHTKTDKEDSSGEKKEKVKKEAKSSDKDEVEIKSTDEETEEVKEDTKDKNKEAKTKAKTETTESKEESEEASSEAEKEAKKERAQKEFVPLGLPKEIRAKWNDIPSEAQLYIAKSQKELNDIKAEAGRKIASYRDMDAVLAPYIPQMQKIGVAPASVVQRLLQYSDALAGPQKYQALQQLAGDFNIDLGRFGGNQQTQTQEGHDNDQLAPEVVIPQYIDENLHATNQKLDAIMNEFNGMRLNQQNANDKAAEQAVNSWAGLDVSTGQYKNKPYFPYVRQSMYQLIANGTVPVTNDGIDLDAAYDMACYLNPEIRERQAEEATAKVTNNRASKVDKINKSKTAGSSIKTGARILSSTESVRNSSSKSNSHAAGESVRDSLRRAITEMNQ